MKSQDYFFKLFYSVVLLTGINPESVFMCDHLTDFICLFGYL